MSFCQHWFRFLALPVFSTFVCNIFLWRFKVSFLWVFSYFIKIFVLLAGNSPFGYHTCCKILDKLCVALLTTVSFIFESKKCKLYLKCTPDVAEMYLKCARNVPKIYLRTCVLYFWLQYFSFSSFYEVSFLKYFHFYQNLCFICGEKSLWLS